MDKSLKFKIPSEFFAVIKKVHPEISKIEILDVQQKESARFDPIHFVPELVPPGKEFAFRIIIKIVLERGFYPKNYQNEYKTVLETYEEVLKKHFKYVYGNYSDFIFFKADQVEIVDEPTNMEIFVNLFCEK